MEDFPLREVLMFNRSLLLGFMLACAVGASADGDQAQHWVRIGTGLYNQGDLAGAQDAFSKATRLDPSNAAAFQGLGSCLLKQGKQDEGLAALKQSSALDPSNQGLAAWLHQVSAQAQASPPPVADAVSPSVEAGAPPVPAPSPALAASPSPLAIPVSAATPAPAMAALPASPLDNLLAEGDGLLSQGKAADAEVAYRGLLYLGPEASRKDVAARAYEGLGQSLYQQGRFDEAGPALLSSLSLEPQNPVLQSFLIDHPELGARQELPGPRNRLAPLWRSAILPGWGQTYNGEPKKGLALGTLALGCLAGTAYSYLQAQNAYSEYSSLGSSASRAEFDDAYGRTQNWGTANHVFYALFGAFYAYTLVDAALDAKPMLQPTLSLSRGGAMLAGLQAAY
jgi:tetratricopeptide (TPR) repeat protein